MRLSPHFTLEEFVFSQTAARRGIDNTPPPDVYEALKDTANRMEEVRALLSGSPIRVSSGYRCGALNRAVRGSKGSAHMKGVAVDFTVSGWPVLTACRTIEASGIQYDQLIHEFGAWVHISFDRKMRRESLTVSSAGTLHGLHPIVRR